MRSSGQVFCLFLLAVGSSYSTARATISFSGDTQVGSSFNVGYTGYGTFRIDGGSVYTTQSGNVTLGYLSTGVGMATVTGAGSQWQFSNSSGIAVGGTGIGRLEVLNGGAITFTQSFGGIDIVANSSSSAQGTVVVDGAGSLIVSNSLDVGPNSSNAGSALLRISNGGMVSAGQLTVSHSGRVELADGTLRSSQFYTNYGDISGSGELGILSTSSFTNSGRLAALNGTLRLTGQTGSLLNNGVISVDAANLEINRYVTNMPIGNNAAEITLRNGSLHVGNGSQPGQLSNSAVLAAIGGTNDLYGTLTNNEGGRVAVTNHSVMVFHDDVLADGGVIAVYPGSTAIFLEDLTINGTATFLANIAGTNDNTGFGTAEVVGTAQLAGNVQVSLGSGFVPQAGDSFQLLAAGSVVGSLGLGDMPSLPSGLKWDLDTEPNRVLLSVVPGLAGDYNGNSVVDAADSVVWRKTLGQTGSDLAADGDNNGIVDTADYDFWRGRFGNSLGASAAGAGAVPEPNVLPLLLLAFGVVAAKRSATA